MSVAYQPDAPPVTEPLSREAFLARLRSEGNARYHHLHPFHVAMHEGQLSREQLQCWVINRFYYQTRIPVKDALLVSKSEDPEFRRSWLRRVVDHDGAAPGEGGLELWIRLGEALGVPRHRMLGGSEVLPGVRFACDAYVNLVKESSLLEGVAASLTEFFSPELMSQRIAAFERHYAYVDTNALEYFRQRVPRARRDSTEAIEFVLRHALTREQQEACVRALVTKTQILWHLLDCVSLVDSAQVPVAQGEVHGVNGAQGGVSHQTQSSRSANFIEGSKP
jgi:pyrroloquinoline-quinone synthase